MEECEFRVAARRIVDQQGRKGRSKAADRRRRAAVEAIHDILASAASAAAHAAVGMDVAEVDAT